MKRRKFLGVLAGTAVALPLAGRAQQSRSMPRVGWLSTGTPTSHRNSLAAFRDGLVALGYSEGSNIAIEYRWAEGNLDRLPQLAIELVQQKVDVIVAGGSFGAQAAKAATSLIPIVAAGTGDLVDLGLAHTLARPGGNVTGFTANSPEAGAKRIQIMKDLMPTARNAAILFNNSSELPAVIELKSALDVVLTFHEVRTLEDLETAFGAMSKNSPDILVALNDPFIFTHRKLIIEAAASARLPAIYGFREYADDGGLISYGANISDTYRRAASYVDKVINGEKAADLPVQRPIKFELLINIKAASALGLTVPPTLIARADEVIE